MNDSAEAVLDTQAALQSAGVDLSALPDQEREVIANLSPEELQILIDLRERLDLDGDEVQAFANPPNIGIVIY